MLFRPFRKFGRASLVVFLLPAVVGTRVAHADPATVDLSVAKHAFESAVSLEAERRWVEAALKLRQAIAVKDTPGLRFHLAQCEAEQGHLVEASLEYDRASELIRRGAKAPDVQQLLGPASYALKPRIPRVTVELPPDLKSPTASLDGKVYAPSELALGTPLNPGRHSLRVSAVGRRPFEQVLVLSEGEPLLVRPQLALATPPAASVAPVASVASTPGASTSARSASTAAEKPTSSTKLYLMIGESVLTVAGLSVGIGAQFAASSATSRVARAQQIIEVAAPNDGAACNRAELTGACRDLHSAIDDHHTALIVSDVGFITAAVGAAALVTTWLAYPEPASRSTGLRVRPVAGFGRVGLVGSF